MRLYNSVTPLSVQGIAGVSERDAIAAFAFIGEQADSVELCYFLTGNQGKA